MKLQTSVRQQPSRHTPQHIRSLRPVLLWDESLQDLLEILEEFEPEEDCDAHYNGARKTFAEISEG